MSEKYYKYLFKYNKKGDLYNYIEFDKKSKLSSYYYILKNTLIRYDKKLNTKHLIRYHEDIMMLHRFEAGESWITMTVVPTYNNTQTVYKFPKYYHQISDQKSININNINFEIIPPTIVKQILLENNNIQILSLNKNHIQNWTDGQVLQPSASNKISFSGVSLS